MKKQSNEIDMEGCGACGGPLVELGGLGNLMHYRCQNCGMEQSQEAGAADMNPPKVREEHPMQELNTEDVQPWRQPTEVVDRTDWGAADADVPDDKKKKKEKPFAKKPEIKGPHKWSDEKRDSKDGLPWDVRGMLEAETLTTGEAFFYAPKYAKDLTRLGIKKISFLALANYLQSSVTEEKHPYDYEGQSGRRPEMMRSVDGTRSLQSYLDQINWQEHRGFEDITTWEDFVRDWWENATDESKMDILNAGSSGLDYKAYEGVEDIVKKAPSYTMDEFKNTYPALYADIVQTWLVGDEEEEAVDQLQGLASKQALFPKPFNEKHAQMQELMGEFLSKEAIRSFKTTVEFPEGIMNVSHYSSPQTGWDEGGSTNPEPAENSWGFSSDSFKVEVEPGEGETLYALTISFHMDDGDNSYEILKGQVQDYSNESALKELDEGGKRELESDEAFSSEVFGVLDTATDEAVKEIMGREGYDKKLGKKAERHTDGRLLADWGWFDEGSNTEYEMKVAYTFSSDARWTPKGIKRPTHTDTPSYGDEIDDIEVISGTASVLGNKKPDGQGYEIASQRPLTDEEMERFSESKELEDWLMEQGAEAQAEAFDNETADYLDAMEARDERSREADDKDLGAFAKLDQRYNPNRKRVIAGGEEDHGPAKKCQPCRYGEHNWCEQKARGEKCPCDCYQEGAEQQSNQEYTDYMMEGDPYAGTGGQDDWDKKLGKRVKTAGGCNYCGGDKSASEAWKNEEEACCEAGWYTTGGRSQGTPVFEGEGYSITKADSPFHKRYYPDDFGKFEVVAYGSGLIGFKETEADAHKLGREHEPAWANDSETYDKKLGKRIKIAIEYCGECERIAEDGEAGKCPYCGEETGEINEDDWREDR